MKILAVSSGGGHWEQLQLLREAFSAHEVCYVTTDLTLAAVDSSILVIPDCNRNRPSQALLSAGSVYRIIRRIRPDVIVTTGAAPGLIAIIIGRICGAHTVWIDSVANAEQLSLSGRLAKWVAHLCLTQWPHLARRNAPLFYGSVL